MIRTARAGDLNEMMELCALHAQHEGLAFSETGQVERWKAALFGPAPRLYAWVMTLATVPTVTLVVAAAIPPAHLNGRIARSGCIQHATACVYDAPQAPRNPTRSVPAMRHFEALSSCDSSAASLRPAVR